MNDAIIIKRIKLIEQSLNYKLYEIKAINITPHLFSRPYEDVYELMYLTLHKQKVEVFFKKTTPFMLYNFN